MRYAVIKDNQVINIIKADESFAASYAEMTGNLLVNVESVYCDIGYQYIDGAFIPSAPAE